MIQLEELVKRPRVSPALATLVTRVSHTCFTSLGVQEGLQDPGSTDTGPARDQQLGDGLSTPYPLRREEVASPRAATCILSTRWLLCVQFAITLLMGLSANPRVQPATNFSWSSDSAIRQQLYLYLFLHCRDHLVLMCVLSMLCTRMLGDVKRYSCLLHQINANTI